MVELFVALIAGFVSFISPCVLPLVPAYIGYMSGRVTNAVSAQIQTDGTLAAKRPFSQRFSTFTHGVAFVLGFTLIFVTLGLMSTAFISTFGSTKQLEGTIGRIGGVLIIFFGLHFMGTLSWVFRHLRNINGLLNSRLFSLIAAVLGSILIAWMFTNTLYLWDTARYPPLSGIISLAMIGLLLFGLVAYHAFSDPYRFWDNLLNSLDYMLYADTRRQIAAEGDQGLIGSSIMGVVFAAGWSPCIGPTLGLALTLAANNPDGADLTRATGLMTAYSLGLGIPFLITALMLDSAQGGLRRLNRHMNTIKVVSGAFLIFIGFTVANGDLQTLSLQLSSKYGRFSYRVEECFVGTIEGDIHFGQTWGCLGDNPDYNTLVALNNGWLTQDDIDNGMTSLDVDPAKFRESNQSAEQSGG